MNCLTPLTSLLFFFVCFLAKVRFVCILQVSSGGHRKRAKSGVVVSRKMVPIVPEVVRPGPGFVPWRTAMRAGRYRWDRWRHLQGLSHWRHSFFFCLFVCLFCYESRIIDLKNSFAKQLIFKNQILIQWKKWTIHNTQIHNTTDMTFSRSFFFLLFYSSNLLQWI